MEQNEKANFYLQETKELLGKRKYKLVIDKVEKHLNRHREIFTQQSVLSSLLLAQSHAACKLLQRNLFKKKPYRKDLILFIIGIITRNLQNCQVILVTRMRRTNILSDQIGAPNSYPQPQRLSCESKEVHIRQAQAQKDQISKHAKILLKMLKWSYGVLLITYEHYGIELQPSKIYHFTCVMKNTYFKNLKSKILQVQVVMLKARRLHSGELMTVQKSEELLNWSIDHILELMHIVKLKLFRNQRDCSGCTSYETKYQRIQLKLLRLLILSLVLSNRNKIRLGQTQMARSAIGVLISLFESITQSSFKIEIHHQIDLQKHFLHYLQEKQEIATLIAPYFRREVKQLAQTNFSLSENPMVQHFNSIAFSSAIDQGMITEIRQKSDCSQKVKKPVFQHIKNSAVLKQGNILSCHINEHVEELNNNFLRETSRINKKGPSKLELNASTRQSILKKSFARIIIRNSINDLNKPQSLIYQLQGRTTRLLHEDQSSQQFIAHKKELLKTKRNHFNTIQELKSDITEPSLPCKTAKNITSDSLSIREGQIAQLESRNQDPLKRNQIILKQSRSAEFMSILFENREELGIVKIFDKIEQLSKKHVDKYESLLEQVGKKQGRENFFHKKPEYLFQNEHWRLGKNEKSNYRIGAKNIKYMQEKLRLERLANIQNSQLNSPRQYFKMEVFSETQSLARKGLGQWRDP